ncbi:MAG: DUF378 domain-containing protein [Candidatus Moranbacteria bacterium]|nr:DUF378 domain-containing protein [Candidatus Moranbacteria bacterium]
MEETKEEKDKKDVISWIALVLLVIGGLNWGLVGLIKLDLVKAIFGEMTTLSRIIYLLVGISAVYMVLMPPKMDKK